MGNQRTWKAPNEEAPKKKRKKRKKKKRKKDVLSEPDSEDRSKGLSDDSKVKALEEAVAKAEELAKMAKLATFENQEEVNYCEANGFKKIETEWATGYINPTRL